MEGCAVPTSLSQSQPRWGAHPRRSVWISRRTIAVPGADGTWGSKVRSADDPDPLTATPYAHASCRRLSLSDISAWTPETANRISAVRKILQGWSVQKSTMDQTHRVSMVSRNTRCRSDGKCFKRTRRASVLTNI